MMFFVKMTKNTGSYYGFGNSVCLVYYPFGSLMQNTIFEPRII